MYDALIVGAGLYGATVARQLLDRGKRVLVVEKREHIAGNCYDEWQDGQLVSRFGGHIFHTSDARIWQFVNRFADWRTVTHLKVAQHGERVFSFPINLLTLHQLWGVTNEAEARAEVERRRSLWADPHASMEGWCLYHLGAELYETFVYGYTRKQWGRDPSELPASIIKRIPVRFDWNARMFDDTYEAVPVPGYTALVAAMLDGTDVALGVDYISQRAHLDGLARVTVYSGPLDALYGGDLGWLGYRSLRFEYQTGATLGAETINYTGMERPYTRRVDFAQIRREKHPAHVVMTEYPSAEGPPMYPIRDAESEDLHTLYSLRAMDEGLIVGGRLGKYQYLDMHQAIGMALKDARALCG